MALFVAVCVVRTFTAEGAGLSFNTGVQDASHNMPGATAYTPTRTFIGSPFVTDRRASERAAAYMNPNVRFRISRKAALGHEATIVAARADWLAQQLREPAMEHAHCTTTIREPWNKGKLVGQKAPFKLKEIWAIRIRLQLASRHRDLALFYLAIDSTLRACDLVKLRVRDLCHGGAMSSRAIVLQQKTQRPVQFEITEPTREAVGAWIGHAGLTSESPLFPSRLHGSAHLSTRRYARIVHSWVRHVGLDEASYWTHTLTGTKATLI